MKIWSIYKAHRKRVREERDFQFALDYNRTHIPCGVCGGLWKRLSDGEYQHTCYMWLITPSEEKL